MSMTSGGPGWWLASDGRWYPPETHPDYQRQMEAFARPPVGPPQGPPVNPLEMSAPGPIPPAFTFANGAPEQGAPAAAPAAAMAGVPGQPGSASDPFAGAAGPGAAGVAGSVGPAVASPPYGATGHIEPMASEQAPSLLTPPTAAAPVNAAPVNAAPVNAAPVNAAPVNAAPTAGAPATAFHTDPAGAPRMTVPDGAVDGAGHGMTGGPANGAAARTDDVVQRFLSDASARGLLDPLHAVQDDESLAAAAEAVASARSASEAARAAALSAGNVAEAVQRFTVVRTTEAEIGELLIRCQQFIEGIVADAQRQAHEIVTAARAEADRILAEASRRTGVVAGPAPQAPGQPGFSSESARELNSTIDGYIRVNNELMHELRLLSGSFGPVSAAPPQQGPPPAPEPTYPRP